MKKCAQCGRETMDDAKFCQFCGAKFEADEKPVAETVQYSPNEAPPLPDTDTYGNYQQPNGSDRPAPPNKGIVWLVLSSVITFFGCCCIPFGFLQIATIVTSAISVSRYKKADYEGSEQMARTSKILFFAILGAIVLITISFVATGVFENILDSYSDIADGFY